MMNMPRNGRDVRCVLEQGGAFMDLVIYSTKATEKWGPRGRLKSNLSHSMMGNIPQ